MRLSPPRRSPPSRYLVITQALAAIAERFLPEGYFSEDLRGVYMDQHLAFAVFLPHRLPRLAAHFTKLEFPLTLIGLRWFLCLFAADLSAQSTCRLWDVVFSHGAHVANPNPTLTLTLTLTLILTLTLTPTRRARGLRPGPRPACRAGGAPG